VKSRKVHGIFMGVLKGNGIFQGGRVVLFVGKDVRKDNPELSATCERLVIEIKLLGELGVKGP